jgi:predicted amidohydrolase
VLFPAGLLQSAHEAVVTAARQREIAAVIGLSPRALWCIDAGLRQEVSDPDERIVTLRGLRVGLLCSADLRRAALVHDVAERGCDLLATCAADSIQVAAAQQALAVARAIDCQVPHAYVNAVGRRDGVRFAGGSRLTLPGAEGIAGWRSPRSEQLANHWLSTSNQERIA